MQTLYNAQTLLLTEQSERGESASIWGSFLRITTHQDPHHHIFPHFYENIKSQKDSFGPICIVYSGKHKYFYKNRVEVNIKTQEPCFTLT